jgi:hypothetical protein
MTGVYDHAFIVNALMAVMSTVVISFVGKSKFELQSNEP